MSDETISQQLGGLFQKASVNFVGNVLKSDADHAEFTAINQNSAERQDELIRRYYEEYDVRVDLARKRLYDEAAQFSLDHPPPPGGDTNRAGEIDREAHRQVREQHDADLRQARDEAQRVLEDFLNRAYQRGQTKEPATEAFLRATNRRSGQDRRTFSQSQE